MRSNLIRGTRGSMTELDTPAGDQLARFDTDGLVHLLVGGDQAAATDMLDSWIDQGAGYADIAVSGIQPALYRIGEMWGNGQISVAQEHLATAMCESLLMRAFEAAEFAESRDESALFACVQNNRHALGLRIVSDTFAIAGWRVHFLGANVSMEKIVRHVQDIRPDFVGLSIATSDQVSTAHEVIEAIRAVLGDDAPRVAVGGRPLLENPEAREALGDAAWAVSATDTEVLP